MSMYNYIKEFAKFCIPITNIKGLKRRKRRALLPKKGLGIFSYQDLIFWPNVINTTSDDFLPHHLVFYVIFDLLCEKIQKWPKTQL